MNLLYKYSTAACKAGPLETKNLTCFYSWLLRNKDIGRMTLLEAKVEGHSKQLHTLFYEYDYCNLQDNVL